MGTPRFTPEFKQEAVRQITERGYSVAEVAERLGVFAHSLYKWPLPVLTARPSRKPPD
nr:transposase [Serratia proteamaculans]